MEKWKVIDGWERYEVSNTGFVRNSETRKLLRMRYDKNGYQIITFSIDGKRTTRKVHRLVAEAFIPNTGNKPQVNHKDGNHQNNHVDNLEWCTSSENHLHAYKMLGRKAHRSEKAGREKKKVLCVDTGETYESAMEAAKAIGGKQGPLSTVCRNERKTYKGKRWRYIA